MCGINGIISPSLDSDQRRTAIKRMNVALSHRGPDNEGAFEDEFLSFGHRRLSIIDPAPEGNQPFFSEDGNLVLIYNGELYNYRELKLQLQAAAHGSSERPFIFRTSSDTEVILAAYMRWGRDCLAKFHGMYAFAVYDIQRKEVFIARDRLGVKPLYYSFSDEGFVFSSEVRSILKSGIRKFKLNEEALPEYIMYQTVHAPNTIVKGIKVLRPGHYLVYTVGTLKEYSYYDLNKIPQRDLSYSYDQVCGRINELLYQSVQRRMVADVPFGAFLSGGIDSSIIVGLMSRISSSKVETFNISFEEGEFSESEYARMVAKKFNCNHHEIILRPRDFLGDLPEALAAMDHPGGDGPNTYVVSKATRKSGIKMALSGVGGDELFAGYEVFKRLDKLRRNTLLQRLPRSVRSLAGTGLNVYKGGVAGAKIKELLSLESINFGKVYPLTRTLFSKNEFKGIFGNRNYDETVKAVVEAVPQVDQHFLSSITLAETQTYLQNVLLRDADQMGMAVALEIREPFLDHELIEFVLSVKDDFKLPHSPKKLLVDSVGDLLPSEVVNRPKMGFTLPWALWMKGELRQMCEGNLEELAQRNFIFSHVPELFRRFLKGDRRVTWSRIWHLVILNFWTRENLD